jgi:hypothetical protein
MSPVRCAGLVVALAIATVATAQPDARPWTPPADDPSRITSEDYLRALAPYEAQFEKRYGSNAARSSGYAYEAVPVFASWWKATKDPRYAAMALNALDAYGRFVKDDIASQKARADKKTGRPVANFYWTSYYLYLVRPILEMREAPNHAELSRRLGEILLERAKAFPIYWEIGSQNRAFFAGFWYDAAAAFAGDGKVPEAMRHYSDEVWRTWWDVRDVEEDDPHYTALDLAILDEWGQLRHAEWWKDPKAAILWRSYASQLANDGTWPPYGDGGAYGEYFIGLRTAELVASRLRDGQYKWLAHRAFWNGRDRLPTLVAGVGLERVTDLALAYLYCDDSVQEVPPRAGLTVTTRAFRERTDWTNAPEGSPLYVLHPERAPSKLIFRGGSDTASQFLMVQAASAGGHGHPDTGSVLFYGGGFSYYLSHGVTRLDYAMEQHNMLAIEDPDSKVPWKQGDYAVESTSVPMSGTARDASYARLDVSAYPGTQATAAAWQAVKDWDGKGYPPRKAVGYRNWPVQLKRSVLFVHDKFTVVRDVVRFLQPIHARLGQNWVIGEVGKDRGEHWLDVRTPEVFGYPFSDPPKARMALAGGNLLIWFAPRRATGAELVEGPRNSWYNKNYINLPNRVWDPLEGTWSTNQELSFVTVLYPHGANEEGRDAAARIELRHDEPEAAAILIRTRGANYVIFFGRPGHEITIGDLRTDAEAAIVSSEPSGVRFASWGATRSSWKDIELKAGPGMVDQEVCATPGCAER